ncbi:MAG: amidohydrolase family protein [Clostridia bacterium]
MKPSFVLKGDLAFTPSKEAFSTFSQGFLVCENGRISGVFPVLPACYDALPCLDFSNCLIVPGLSDTHLHAPQYAYRGLGMDLELLEWLNSHAFPEEARYQDMRYAQAAYSQFADALTHSATTRACVFATVHVPATLCLMEALEKRGFHGYVGKVNMDRNSPDDLCETNAQAALAATEEWLARTAAFAHVKPVLTPRFAPSCSDQLLRGLGAMHQKSGLPVQSHLSENPSEVQWVRELCPQASCYGDVYARFGLLDGDAQTVMAHCVYPTETEIALLREHKVLVSHCPASNMNLSSGIAPIRRYLQEGVRVSLGTDIAGGYDLSIFRAMADAVQVSKLLFRYGEEHPRPLTLSEAFYLGTKGGGSLFGKVGSFEPGYACDAVVLDDSALVSPCPLSVEQRVERAVYLDRDVQIKHKYIDGLQVL